MSIFVAFETESLFGTHFSFFWGEFLEFDHIYIHDIGVLGHHSGRREGLESLGRLSALLGNLFCVVPLVLEMDCF